MSLPDYLKDMESDIANYLGEDPLTFSINENPTVSAPVDSPEHSSDGLSGHFTWDEFFEGEGIEANIPPHSAWEETVIEPDIYGDEIVPPPTVDEPSSKEPTQSSRQEEEAGTNIGSDNTNAQRIATPSELEPQPEENMNLSDDDSLFGEDNSDENELPVSNNEDQSNVEVPAADGKPPKPSETKQEDQFDIPDDDSLFGGSISDDIEVPKIDEQHQPKAVAQESKSTPELVADTPQHSDSAASTPTTPDTDLNNADANIDNDYLFGEFDDSGFQNSEKKDAIAVQAIDNVPTETPTDDVDGLLGSEFGADFGAELEAGLEKDDSNAVAPAIPKYTGIHLPDPPRKVINPQGLYLPDPPQRLNLPDCFHVGANPQGLHLPSPPATTVTQQSVVDTLTQEQAGMQEYMAPSKRRRVRASRIPKSDMSQPKGKGQVGRVITQLSGPDPSELPDNVSGSSSRADDIAHTGKVTRLPRWSFGKYGNFGKPVAGSRYRKPNNSAKDPIPIEDEEESEGKTNKAANPQSSATDEPLTKVSGAIDLTADLEDDFSMDSFDHANHIGEANDQSIQINADGQDSVINVEKSSIPLQNYPAPIGDHGEQTWAMQSPQYYAQTLRNSSSGALQYDVPPYATTDINSISGRAPLSNSHNDNRAQVPNVHGTSRAGLFPNHVYQSPYTMNQTGAHHMEYFPQPMQNDNHAHGNYEAGNSYSLGGYMARDTFANGGDSTSSGLNDNRPKKRPSHERAEYGDPRVLMTYDEFKQIFPYEQTRGCFEAAIQHELAEDAAIVARGEAPPQRSPIRKSIICTWSQVQHLNRIRASNGEKLFEPKPNAHKRPEAFKERSEKKRRERGETTDSGETDVEPEAKRLRIAPEAIQEASSPIVQYGDRIPEVHPTQPGYPQGSAGVSHPPSNHGISEGPRSQNMGRASFMHIHQPVAHSVKRKVTPAQWESFESGEQEMVPKIKRPRLASLTSQNSEPMNNNSRLKEFQKYISERQSEYLKLRVPELRQQCATRKVTHDNVNLLAKGGLVGVLVGQDVSRHPVYSQMDNQAQARFANRQENSIPAAPIMGERNPLPVNINGAQQQVRVPNGWRIRQDLPRPNVDPVHGIGLNHHQQAQSQLPHTDGHRASSPASMASRNSAQSAKSSGLNGAPSHGHSRPVNGGRIQQLYTNGNPSGLVNNGGQPLTSIRRPHNINQAYQGSMINPSRANSYARSQLPVNAHDNGYNNSGIHQNMNGGRNNYTSASAQVPTHGMYGGFGSGFYQPAIDDRRRKPNILGQGSMGDVPQGAQRSFPQPAVNNAGGRFVGSQQPIIDGGSGNLHGGHQENTRGGVQYPRPSHSGNMGAGPQRHMQNPSHGVLYSALMQGLLQGALRHHAAAPGFPLPYFGRRPNNPFDAKPSGPAPPG